MFSEAAPSTAGWGWSACWNNYFFITKQSTRRQKYNTNNKKKMLCGHEQATSTCKLLGNIYTWAGATHTSTWRDGVRE